jgi:RNA polymerase sigma-70 factor (ECF subfamily)
VSRSDDLDLAIFEGERARLVRLAYRMLGSRSAAEDIVQEAWLRWSAARTVDVREPAAFLSRTVTRLCLDELKSARTRRETYVGEWLPEPLVEPEDPGPDADDLTLSLMLALERLSPLERAAFLLHDVFGRPLDEVATTLDRAAPAVRQLAARARRHVQEARPRFPVDRAEGERIARAFFAASHSGDVAALGTLLSQAVVIRADGGGKVNAFRNPIVGIDRVSRLYERLARKNGWGAAEWLGLARIDGLPGYVSRERGGIVQTTAFDIEAGRIVAIYITRNPDKLGHVLAAVGNRAAIARRAAPRTE